MDKSYARALWRLIEGGKAPKEAVVALNETLIRHGRAGLMPRILRAFRILSSAELKKTEQVLTIADTKDTQKALHESGAKKGAVRTQIDETVIGGWKLEGNGSRVDATYKRFLLEIYKGVTGSAR